MYNEGKKKLGRTIYYLVKKDGRQFHISKREKECIELVTRGFSMKMIAKVLNISSRTVEYYLQCVRYKLNCSSKFAMLNFFHGIEWQLVSEKYLDEQK